MFPLPLLDILNTDVARNSSKKFLPNDRFNINHLNEAIKKFFQITQKVEPFFYLMENVLYVTG